MSAVSLVLLCVICLLINTHMYFHFFREILVEESNVQRVDSPVTVSNIYSLLSLNLPGCQINVVIMFLLLFLTGLWRYTRSVL